MIASFAFLQYIIIKTFLTSRFLANELLYREIFEVHNNGQNTNDVTTLLEVQSEPMSGDDTNDVTQESSDTCSRSGSSFQESEAETVPAEAETAPDVSLIEVSGVKGKEKK